MSYFTINELCKSITAQCRGIENKPNASQEENLNILIKECLNPIRSKYNKAIVVNSGFRSTALNNAVGGVKNSQHLTGCAADIKPLYRDDLIKLYYLIIDNFEYDQCILYKGFIHISYNKENNRNESFQVNKW